MILGGDGKSSFVGGGVLNGDFFASMEMSESSIKGTNKVAEEFGQPCLRHSKVKEDLSFPIQRRHQY